jgi:hypothetical protein
MGERMMPTPKTVERIRLRTSDTLDGYVFTDITHATEWLTQPLIVKHWDEYQLEKVLVQRNTYRCSCCALFHWKELRLIQKMTVHEFLQEAKP